MRGRAVSPSDLSTRARQWPCLLILAGCALGILYFLGILYVTGLHIFLPPAPSSSSWELVSDQRTTPVDYVAVSWYLALSSQSWMFGAILNWAWLYPMPSFQRWQNPHIFVFFMHYVWTHFTLPSTCPYVNLSLPYITIMVTV